MAEVKLILKAQFAMFRAQALHTSSSGRLEVADANRMGWNEDQRAKLPPGDGLRCPTCPTVGVLCRATEGIGWRAATYRCPSCQTEWSVETHDSPELPTE